MGIIKGQLANNDAEVKEVTVSEEGSKTLLDVNIASGDATQTTELQEINNKLLGNVVPSDWDDINITYVTSGNGTGEIETVTYSLEGSPIVTLSLSYDSGNRLIGVSRA